MTVPAAARLALQRVLVVLVLSLVGCGVEPQRSPEPVPGARLPSALASPTEEPRAQARVWGVRDRRLVAVFVPLSRETARSRLEALLALPAVARAPLTALRPGTRVVSMKREGDLVVVTLSPELREVGRRNLPLALGQVVLTLTEDEDVSRVVVRDPQGAIALVTGRGRQVLRPLLRDDFSALVDARSRD